MLDLETSINVIPLSIYKELKLEQLKKTKVVIQLADSLNILLERVLEDIVLTVNHMSMEDTLEQKYWTIGSFGLQYSRIHQNGEKCAANARKLETFPDTMKCLEYPF